MGVGAAVAGVMSWRHPCAPPTRRFQMLFRRYASAAEVLSTGTAGQLSPNGSWLNASPSQGGDQSVMLAALF